MGKKKENMKIEWVEGREVTTAKLEHIMLKVELPDLPDNSLDDFELDEKNMKIVVCDDGTFKVGEHVLSDLKKAKVLILKNVMAEIAFSIVQDEEGMEPLKTSMKELKDRIKFQSSVIDFLQKKKKNIKNK